ncbi:casein kinase II beta 1 subunit [Pseudovirgaria hyperparasitica]|uniref:Casein kinase II subunit beta n=1 Tax=Pseudovirgaria hyperparasitica TaxID=470096 RepID=A0A6A6WIC2_9PEZI|nr:casein kinase II beta 1 subunit [Pseudovirgaria hyperparasitica]KAF2761814.1 casein kinase II beta 1 subunit [Pseudovirgaria hyperparasitica]
MSSSSQVAESWISSFCSLLGHEYFAEVSEDFIEDDFNLTGLQSQVPMYKEALEMILDVEPDDDEDEEDEEDEDEDEEDMLGEGDRPTGYRRAGDRRHMRMASDLSMIESSAELLYGLIHQRFIISRPGIQQMAEKYDLQHFGLCPRVNCNGVKVLPVGCSDTPGQETVKLFCPSCLDVYTPPNSRFQSVDGAFFGTTFGCLFFMTFPELDVGTMRVQTDDRMASDTNSASTIINGIPATSRIPLPPQPSIINGVAPHNLAPGLGTGNIHEPRIYGFRVSERARSGPRMKWLRSRPDDINELDEAKRFWEDQEEVLEDEGTEMEEEAMDGQQGIDADEGSAIAASVKKARKAQLNGGVSPMDTNGVGEGG